MADVIVKVADEHAGKNKEELLKLLDEEVEKFSTFMGTLPDWRIAGALNSGERALLKTYLVHKINGKLG